MPHGLLFVLNFDDYTSAPVVNWLPCIWELWSKVITTSLKVSINLLAYALGEGHVTGMNHKLVHGLRFQTQEIM
jgi:hypothetical protein